MLHGDSAGGEAVPGLHVDGIGYCDPAGRNVDSGGGGADHIIVP
jgi:hypothetical protein